MKKKISEMTPVEIDTVLYRLFEKEGKLIVERHGLLAAAKKANEVIEEINRKNPEYRFYTKETYLDGRRRAQKSLKKNGAELDAVRAEAEPYNDEFRSRPWHRYFLVTSSVGHVHRNMTCTTCYPTTTYAWIVELADCDEREMVAEYGDVACTVCFPDAPVKYPAEWKSGTEKREAREGKDLCPGGGKFVGEPARVTSKRCPDCGDYQRVSRYGILFRHQKPEPKMYCTGSGQKPKKVVFEYSRIGRCAVCNREREFDKNTGLLLEHEAPAAKCTGVGKDAVNVQHERYGDCPDCGRKSQTLTKKQTLASHTPAKRR